MFINRILIEEVQSKIGHGKAIIIMGPRQAGKSTLLAQLAKQTDRKYILLDCDESDIRSLLTNTTSTALKNLIGDATLVLIDEAQRVKNIGLTLKLFTDKIKEIQLVVTGSSAFELSNEINEPLTGRKFEYLMLPLSTTEMALHHGIIDEKRLLYNRLIFGMYPEVVSNPGKEIELLKGLSNSYLYKDIFTFHDVRKPEMIEQLLKALSLQVGNEVSYNELAKTIGSDQLTVQRYLNLLEKSFVVFRLPAYSRNLRNELTKSRKIYFYDNGIRNAILGNYALLPSRTDTGKLWENFLISERMKWLQRNRSYTLRYFWRTTESREIDYLEEFDGKLLAFEFKWNPDRKVTFPKPFLKAYPEAVTHLIHQENYFDFLNE
ncbi:MAG: ATP-binding protein [Saprospiraceae bacterium]|nr:ATP-binding protein [Saprospiraceae bacterium]